MNSHPSPRTHFFQKWMPMGRSSEMCLTKTQDWPFLRYGLCGSQIGYKWTPQKILRHPRRCKIEFKRKSVFFTFGPTGLENPFLAKKRNSVEGIQGVPKKTPGYVQRLITPAWKELLGYARPFLDFSGSQLSFEPKKSRIW